MPRGIPKAGHRRFTGAWSKHNPNRGVPMYGPGSPGYTGGPSATAVPQIPVGPIQEVVQPSAPVSDPALVYGPPVPQSLLDEALGKKIEKAFSMYEKMCRRMVAQKLKAMIVSGDPGSGKSYIPEMVLKEHNPIGDQYQIIKGFSRNTGLYQALYRMRNAGQITVFDDCDSVFLDPNGLNLIKCATDSTAERIISWGALTRMTDDAGNDMPTSFTYDGHIIFITNFDFDRAILRGHALKHHFEAMQSRSSYVDLGIHNRRAGLIRTKQVLAAGVMLAHLKDRHQEILDYMEEHLMDLREVSLRTAIKIGEYMDEDGNEWRESVDFTQLKKDLV